MSIFFDDAISSSGYSVVRMSEIIGRTNLDGIRVIEEIFSGFEITEHMIPTREHIETEILHCLDMLGSRSLAGGDIFGVSDDEIGIVFVPQSTDIISNHTTSSTSEYVSEYEDFHKNDK